jgi:hypothetical protein
MPGETDGKIQELISKGDRYYKEAVTHLHNSDPNENPTGWADENAKARDLFMKANQDGYMPAQEAYGSKVPPKALLDRVRETMMRASMCRKRSVCH